MATLRDRITNAMVVTATEDRVTVAASPVTSSAIVLSVRRLHPQLAAATIDDVEVVLP